MVQIIINAIKTPIALLLLILPATHSFGQAKKNTFITIAGERTFISTMGDAEGYSFIVGLSKFYTKTINLGIDFRFSSALERPYLLQSFYHKSVAYIEPKISFYPLNTLRGRLQFLNGLGITMGCSAFYGQFSQEHQWVSTIDLNTGQEVDRVSRLSINEKFDFGYLVHLNYMVKITKNFWAGAGVSFANYINNDGYSSFGLASAFKL